MNCVVDYGSDLLNKVYGGMACQPHGDLPLTGFNAADIIVIGFLVLLLGAFFVLSGD